MNTKDLAHSIETLPIASVIIATLDGPRETDAYIIGDWAINETAKGWTATHHRTGYCGRSFPTPIEALISLGIYIGAGLRIPNDMTMETIKDEFRDIPGIADVGRRIKDAIMEMEGWNL